jgi:DNA-binding MarR family transcriptional regulator
MVDRKKKVEELLEDFMSMRRRMGFKGGAVSRLPAITPSQWHVIMCIRHSPGSKSTIKEIASTLAMTSSAATQLVDGLVRSGYVERKRAVRDRRAVALSLSAKTKKHVESMKRAGVAQFVHMFTALSDREFEQYCALNKKIAREMLKGNAVNKKSA